MSTSIHTTRLSSVRAIGKGIRVSDTLTDQIVSALPVDFDVTARGALTTFISKWVNGDAPAPAQRTGGKGGPRTDYGIGFDALVTSVKRALTSSEPPVEHVTVTYVDSEGKSHSATVALDSDLAATVKRLTVASE